MSNNIKLATCPCSWGVWYPQDELQPSWHKFLDEAAEIGHSVIELGPYGYLPSNVDQLKDELAARNMSVCSTAHMSDLIVPGSLDNLRRDIDKICPLLVELGAEYFVFMDGDELYPHPSDRNLNLSQWRHVIEVIGESAKIVQEEYGLKYAYHPHVATCIENEHQIIRMLNDTDDKYVNLCFDTGHHLYTGGLPEEFIKEFGSRINYYHLKDMSMEVLSKVKRENLSDNDAFEIGVMVPLGQGNVNFSAVKEAMITTGFNGYAVIEQDIYPDREKRAKSFAQSNLTFALEHGLGCK
ncbi:sugar phosphate isomerase/epimerase family protein [Photobacterium minamisatsumaniensis]|uniref:sugar phosphate isomerase/epimerase family protein n=1 Tax=Photobacterium minamisatsumaniensis TaxID=2910233 RepID=UPI003D0ED652